MAVKPLVDFSQASTWLQFYGLNVGPTAVAAINYSRLGRAKYLGDDHMKLLSALGLKAGQRVALFGAAFGWIVEDWNAAGLICCAVDNSSWIQANLTGNATVPVLNNDITANNTPAPIKKALGASPDWAITEDVISCYSDADVRTIAAACRSLAPNVAHWTTCKAQGSAQDTRLNWHTAAEWKALLAPDLIVQRGQATVA